MVSFNGTEPEGLFRARCSYRERLYYCSVLDTSPSRAVRGMHSRWSATIQDQRCDM